MKLYELILSDEEVQGIDAISVVGSPAMESQFIMLSEEKRVSFAKIDNEKQILLGVAMIPEKKIYRFDEDTRKKISRIAWWNGSDEKVRCNAGELMSAPGQVVLE